MVGAMLPMIVAWRVKARLVAPVVGGTFHLPSTSPIDRKLVAGAALFGVGWGITGLCPGPAFANFAVRPLPSALFIAAMLSGMRVNRLITTRLKSQEPKHAFQQT